MHSDLNSIFTAACLVLVINVAAAAALEGVLSAVAADAMHIRHQPAAARAVQHLRRRFPQVHVIRRELHLGQAAHSGMQCDTPLGGNARHGTLQK